MTHDCFYLLFLKARVFYNLKGKGLSTLRTYYWTTKKYMRVQDELSILIDPPERERMQTLHVHILVML